MTKGQDPQRNEPPTCYREAGRRSSAADRSKQDAGEAGVEAPRGNPRSAQEFIDGMSAPDEARAALIGRLRQRRKAQYWTDRRNTPVEDILFMEAYLQKRPGSR